MIAIVTAMEREAGPVRRVLHEPVCERSASLHVCGVGREAASQWAARLTSDRPSLLLSLGFAGATRPELAAGDLVLSHTLEAPGGRESYAADPALLRMAEAACRQAAVRHWVGDNLTVSRFVGRAEEKSNLGSTTSAWAINMEDYWLAAGAQAAGIPFLAARAIVDRADQSLPPFLASLPLERRGGMRQLARAAPAVGRRPWLLPALLVVARQATLAQRNLAGFVRAFLPLASAMHRQDLVNSIAVEG